MRGTQVSDATGRVEFATLYPGWYRGRTVHIHVKVHVGGNEVHTGQLGIRDAGELREALLRLVRAARPEGFEPPTNGIEAGDKSSRVFV